MRSYTTAMKVIISVLITFWVVILLIDLSSSRDLPSYFPKCYLNDSELNSCIKRAFNALRPYVQNGIDEIKLPSLMPLVIPRFQVTQESSMANYTVTARNYTVRGLQNYDLKHFRYHKNTNTFYGAFEFEPILISLACEVQGSLISVPLEGSGNFDGALGPINGTFEINGELIKRKGVEYYKPTRVAVKLNIEDGVYNFYNLFNNDEGLGRIANEMFNRNSKMLTQAITPLYERLFERAIMKYVKILTKLFSYPNLFPYSK